MHGVTSLWLHTICITFVLYSAINICIFYNLVKGSPVLYPMIVVLLFVLWIGIFYSVYHIVCTKHAAKKQADPQAAPDEMLLHH